MNSQQQQQYRMFGVDPRAAAIAALGTAGVYGANALLGGEDERWDRTAINTAGNIVGAGSGALLGSVGGLPGMVAGAIGGGLIGGYGSDRTADMVDPTQGRISPEELIAAHLEQDPIGQQAYYQEQIRQARLMQKEIDRQKMLQYQAQMSQMGGV